MCRTSITGIIAAAGNNFVHFLVIHSLTQFGEARLRLLAAGMRVSDTARTQAGLTVFSVKSVRGLLANVAASRVELGCRPAQADEKMTTTHAILVRSSC